MTAQDAIEVLISSVAALGSNRPGTLPDWQIAELAEEGMITPFRAEQERFAGTTRGLAEASYDVSLGDEFLLPVQVHDRWTGIGDFVSPELQDGCKWSKISGKFLLMPGQAALAHTVETVTLPDNICARVLDKSTWARLFLQVKNTFIDPGFSGQVTLELHNEGPWPLVLTPGVGIAQLVFERLSAPCRKPYRGRYQGQTGVTAPKPAED